MGGCLSSRSSRRSSLPPEVPAMYSISSSAASRSLKSRKKQKRGGGGTGFFDRRSTAAGGGGEFVEDELHRVPGRMFLNGASEVACMFTQQGRKGTNQDAMVVWENFTLRDDTIFCGVFDGHGPFGHMVAKKVRDSLPLKLSSQWRANMSGSNSPHQNGSVHGSRNSEETASITFDDDYGESGVVNENEKLPEKYLSLKQSFLKAFKSMDKDLKLHPTIDCFCSGTTAVTVVKQGQDLIIGNVGDSRAILGTRDKDNNLVAVQLTVDLKPNLPREAARIHQCKGRVFALQDEPEVARVWLPNNDSPGLAMARAFGDFCLKDYGLISVPDISYRLLMEKDEFVVLATDGIWDVLSNKEVVDIVSSAPTRATASRALVDCAVRAWRMKFPTSKIDDCAAVCLFFDHPPPDQVPESYSTKPPEEPAETLVIGATAPEAENTNPDQLPTGATAPEAENTNPDQLPTGATAPEAENTNPDQLVDGVARTYGSGLNRSSTFHDADEIVSVSDDPKIEKVTGRSQSTRSLADCISATEEEEWSALEGVTRVNSLLNLPRFLSGNKRSASWKKR